MKPGEGVQSRVVGQVLRSVSGQWTLFCLGSLNLVWSLQKPKLSSELVGWTMESRGVGVV